MQDFPQTTAPQSTMLQYSPEPPQNACMVCQEGNRLWLENQSGTNMSLAVTVGSETSTVLPQSAESATMLPNTLSGSGGALEISVNGQSATLLQSVDPGLLTRPEDVQVGVVAARPRNTTRPVAGENRGIPVLSENNTVNLSDFLSDGLSEDNTEVDLVMVCQAGDGQGAITSEGNYVVDDLSDDQLQWLASSIVQNTISSGTNEASGLAVFAGGIAWGQRGQAMAALRELVFGGRFYVKSISSWGGRYAIIFKGAHRSRSFLTATAYGLRNGKMSYISSYADVMAAQAGGGTGAASAARSAAKGNFIGFVIAATFDVNDFIQSEDPEQNWGDLLGALSVTFVKVWIAGFAGVLLAGAIASAAVAAGVASVPVIVVVGLGLGISIAAGFLLDKIDNWLGVKQGARKIGRAFAGAVSRGLTAVASFVEEIATNVDSLIDGWFRDFEQHLRQNDPVGHCALFCSNPLDQLDAWSRGLGGGGLRWR
jgi:hypothetical protein